MEWLLMVGTVIVGALAAWALLGMWAETASEASKAGGRRVAPKGPLAQLPSLDEAPVVAEPEAHVVATRKGARVECQLVDGSEDPVPALSELLQQEAELAGQARERGLERAAKLHDAIAEGVRGHLDELGVRVRKTGSE